MTVAEGAAGTAPEKKVLPPGANGADQGATGAGSHGQDDDSADVDESKWDDKTKGIIAKLRKENASRRTASKALEEKVTKMQEQFSGIGKALGLTTEETPEKRIEALQETANAAQGQAQLYKVALDKGIPGEDVEFFSYLVEKAAGQLADGAEMSEETLDGIVTEVKKRSAKGSATTGVGSGAGNNGVTPPTKGDNEITVEAFAKMTITQKSDIFQKNRELYNSLFQQAKEKKLLT